MRQGSDDGSVWDIGPVEGSAVPDVPAPVGPSRHNVPTLPPQPPARPPADPPARPPARGGAGGDGSPRRRRWLLLALLVALLVVVGIVVATRGDDASTTADTALQPPATVTPVVTEPVATAGPTTEPPMTVAPTTEPAPTVAPATEPAPTVVPTTEPAPTVAPTTVPAPTVPPTTVPVGGPAVIATGREGSCRFGPNCLIVDFVIDGFAAQPTEFVCEFAGGNRFTFRFDSQGVDGACATSEAAGVIIVEVDGVRSNPVTR